MYNSAISIAEKNIASQISAATSSASSYLSRLLPSSSTITSNNNTHYINLADQRIKDDELVNRIIEETEKKAQQRKLANVEQILHQNATNTNTQVNIFESSSDNNSEFFNQTEGIPIQEIPQRIKTALNNGWNMIKNGLLYITHLFKQPAQLQLPHHVIPQPLFFAPPIHSTGIFKTTIPRLQAKQLTKTDEQPEQNQSIQKSELEIRSQAKPGILVQPKIEPIGYNTPHITPNLLVSSGSTITPYEEQSSESFENNQITTNDNFEKEEESIPNKSEKKEYIPSYEEKQKPKIIDDDNNKILKNQPTSDILSSPEYFIPDNKAEQTPPIQEPLKTKDAQSYPIEKSPKESTSPITENNSKIPHSATSQHPPLYNNPDYLAGQEPISERSKIMLPEAAIKE